jgi:hypothetical protein
MTRHVAMLRGMVPVQPGMPELQRGCARASFGQVVTVLTRGHANFDAEAARR